MRGQVPVVDLEEYDRDPQKLREASEKWGCFRLVNHGVPTKLMAEMKEVTRDLLDLPLAIKQRNKDVIPGSGYMAPSEKNPLYEALGLFDAGSSSSVSSFCSQLEASAHQRKIIEEYAEAIQKLAINIATKLAKSMGASDYCFQGWPCQFRINKYTFTPETVGSPGVQIHTDSGFLTILQDDESLGGLEVMDPLGTSFVPVDPCPGTLVVNLGDIAVPWSNGRLRSLQHRVQCEDAGLRFSVATFLSPPADKVVEAPPAFINEENPRMFSLFTYEEYRKLRSTAKLHAGEALQLPWSNGRLRSLQHRVQCEEAGLRFSVATFLSPPADKVVEAPPAFINEENPRMFSLFTYEEYRKLRRTTKLHAGEALQLVRLDK